MPPMPLGDAWSGVCRARPGAEWQPDAATEQQFCNFGYAREKCGRVPSDSADAVRFAIARDQEGLIRISWVMEKDHLPFAHGALEYSSADASFGAAHPDACVAGQAQAYAQSYLIRKAGGRP